MENFRAEWARLVTPLGPAAAPQVSTQQMANGWSAVVGVTNVTRPGASFTVLLLNATGFGRHMSVMASLVGDRHLAAVNQFFEQLELRAGTAVPPGHRPASPTAPAASGLIALAPGGFDGNCPVGLFYRLDATGGPRVQTDVRVFMPGSRIARVFPFGGQAPIGPSRCNPDTCGTYQVDAGQLTVRWDNGVVQRWKMSRSAEGIDLDGGGTFRPARPVTEAELAGQWADAGPVSNVYTFDRNGTFTFGLRQAGGLGGRYRVEGLVLILNFADGTESRRTLFAAGKSRPAGLICVEKVVYARE